MIMNFDKEIAALREVGADIPADKALAIAFVLFTVFDRGVAFERGRVLDIVARKAMNASELRAEINRPLR